MLKKIVSRLKKAFRPHAREPEHPWLSLAAGNAASGLSESLLFLSFDCDTDLDILAAETLAYRLRDKGVKSTFAVPGAQLLRGSGIFRRMADDGFEFMNHGALPHTAWDGEKYIPSTFYAEMELEAITRDMREGDRIVREVTGKAPRGFRAPHFGCFQAPEQINFMHHICHELGYLYASTTMPHLALKRGSWFDNQKVREIPLTGSWREPLNIPDSWSNLTDRKHFILGNRLAELWQESLEHVCSKHLPLLLCWYVDPAHVIGQKSFEDAVEQICLSNIRSVTGTECALGI